MADFSVLIRRLEMQLKRQKGAVAETEEALSELRKLSK